MLSNPWTTLLWGSLHTLAPLLNFFAADALYPRLKRARAGRNRRPSSAEG
jgi:hypothetical protein